MSYPTGLGAMPDDGGVFSTASINQINTNTQATISTGGGQTIAGALTVAGLLTANGGVTVPPSVTLYSGTSDAIQYPNAINVAIFTGNADLATLSTPGSADEGKVLILLAGSGGTSCTVTTSANKILSGSASTWDTLTSGTHAGALAILVASNGFWNTNPLGVGAWTLSEV